MHWLLDAKHSKWLIQYSLLLIFYFPHTNNLYYHHLAATTSFDKFLTTLL